MLNAGLACQIEFSAGQDDTITTTVKKTTMTQ
jgi:hypothetical protein